jgi:hypothetical protein
MFNDIEQAQAQHLIDTERPYRQEHERRGTQESVADWISAGRHWKRWGYQSAFEFFEYGREDK